MDRFLHLAKQAKRAQAVRPQPYQQRLGFDLNVERTVLTEMNEH